MPKIPSATVLAPLALALALGATLMAAKPAAAEGEILLDFGASAGEDVLEGGWPAAEPNTTPLPAPAALPTADTQDGDDANGGGWYARDGGAAAEVRHSGSFTVITLRRRAGTLADVTLVPSGVAYSSEAPDLVGGGPRHIDVESERLDRRGYGPDGIDVVYAGGAKIIRLAPGYDGRR